MGKKMKQKTIRIKRGNRIIKAGSTMRVRTLPCQAGGRDSSESQMIRCLMTNQTVESRELGGRALIERAPDGRSKGEHEGDQDQRCEYRPRRGTRRGKRSRRGIGSGGKGREGEKEEDVRKCSEADPAWTSSSQAKPPPSGSRDPAGRWDWPGGAQSVRQRTAPYEGRDLV